MLELWAWGFVQYFTSTCVGEMPPSSSPFDTGTDNLAHLQKARQLRACEYEHGFHCFVLLATPLFVQHHSFFQEEINGSLQNVVPTKF